MFPARHFSGRTVAVFGLARSGLVCAQALVAGGARVIAWDDSAAALATARGAGLPVSDLREVDFSTLDALMLSPGVPLTHPSPHWTVQRATAAGIEIIGDTEVFCREIEGSGARLVAITGTNGKSTTTALTGHVLRSAGLDAETGGNIGTAVFLLSAPHAGRVYVLEMSSYQIDLTPSLKPDAGVLLNLAPDHLDRHGTMEHYAEVKARLFARQTASDTAVIGIDDKWSAAIAGDVRGQARLVPVSVQRSLEDGVSASGGVLEDRRGGRVIASIDLKGMRALRGRHNWQNACAAYAAASALGMTAEAIAAGMTTFPGLAHRMEEVGRLGPILFVNDSKATNADAAARALSSFDPIYWILGGRAKSDGIDALAPYFPRIARAYLVGEAATSFARVLDGKAKWSDCGTIERAVAAAAKDAEAESRKDAVVLLSPACASFDQYPNFEVRGEVFCEAVKALAGIRYTRGELS
ncbi:MAG: UDP-N-acetylmuramoyl-L-alanine--D-glutamate ligase [Parvibaculaceae bacterium]